MFHEPHLFVPVTRLVLGLEPLQRPGTLFLAHGILTMTCDNVFVATRKGRVAFLVPLTSAVALLTGCLKGPAVY